MSHLIRGLLDQGKLETAMDVFRHLKQRVVSSADDEIADLVHLIIDEDYNGIAMVTATFIEYWFNFVIYERGELKQKTHELHN